MQALSLGSPKFQDPQSKIQSFLVRLLSFELETRSKAKGRTVGWILSQMVLIKEEGPRKITTKGFISHDFARPPSMLGGWPLEWGLGWVQIARVKYRARRSICYNYPRQMPASPILLWPHLRIERIPKKRHEAEKHRHNGFLKFPLYPVIWQISNVWFGRHVPGMTYSWLWADKRLFLSLSQLLRHFSLRKLENNWLKHNLLSSHTVPSSDGEFRLWH